MLGPQLANARRVNDAAFRERLCAALNDIAVEAETQHVLVVTHGGAIRLLRCESEGRDFGDMANIDVPHASFHPLAWTPPAARRIKA